MKKQRKKHPKIPPRTTKKNVVKKASKKISKLLFFDSWFKDKEAVKDDLLFKKMFWGLTAFMLFLMPSVSFDYGLSGDEKSMHYYGQDVIKFYTSMGQDTSYTNVKGVGEGKIMKYYGALFEAIAEGTNTLFHVDDVYATRHFINALFGFVSMLMAAMIGLQIGGWRLAFLTMVLMSVSLRFFGHSMNNTKDIPFAATYILSIFFMIKYIRELAKPSIKTAILLTLSIGLCLNTRVGGLVLIPYLFIFLFVEVILDRKYFLGSLKEKNWKVLKGYIMYPIGIAVIGYLLGSIFWPYALSNPIMNPLNALKRMTEYPVSIKILFDDAHIWSAYVPWYYIPKWLLISAPIVVLVGIVASLIIIPIFIKKESTRCLFYIAFTAFFPLAYATYSGSNLYDGMRHFLFIYPSLVVISAFAWNGVFKLIEKKIVQYSVVGILSAGILYPVYWGIMNHPNQVTYFNPIVGGLRGAYGKYETDYYYNSIKQACDWIIDNISPSDTIIVATTSFPPLEHYFRNYPNIKPFYVRYYQRHTKDWDYGIFYSRFVNHKQLQNGSYPPSQTKHIIEADGIPLVAVVKREDKYDLAGEKALKEHDFLEALRNFELATEKYSKDESSWYGLAIAYFNLGQYNEALQAVINHLNIRPENIIAYITLGDIYIHQNKLSEALKAFNRSIELNESFPYGYYRKALVLVRQGQEDKALQTMLKCVKYNPSFRKQANQLIGQLLQKDTGSVE